MQEADYLPTVTALVFVMIGILFSFIIPWAVKVLKGLKNKTLKPNGWPKVAENKYVIWAVAALAVAVFIVLVVGMRFHVARDAAMAGFAWEALIAKAYQAATTE